MADLGVLIGGYSGEGRLGEGEGLEDAPAHAEQVVRLHDVETRLVAVHGVQDDLKGSSAKQLAQPLNTHLPSSC